MVQRQDLELDETDESCWIPLDQPTTPIHEPILRNKKQCPATASSSRPTPTISNKPDQKKRPQQTPSLRTIQRKLETKQELKRNFVNHPMALFRSKFIVHFARELWSLDISIRLGMLLIVLGVACKCFFMSMWYAWYPRTFVLLLVFIASYVYFDILNLTAVFNSASIEDSLSKLDIAQLRFLSGVLLFIPTFLEMRTLSLLSQACVSGSSSMHISIILSIVLAFFMLYKKSTGFSPRECIQQGYIVLYGAAFFLTLFRTEWTQLPLLAGPFFFASGTLLLATEDKEWVARIVRHSLRLTLRDVLATVGASVKEDEMLQLSMLRWIADYWSNNPSPPQASLPPQNTASMKQSHSAQELSWDELQPMLSMTADQMATEVQSLQKEPMTSEKNSESVSDSASSTKTDSSILSPTSVDSSSSSTTNDPVRQIKFMLARMDIDDSAKPAVMAYKNAVETFRPSQRSAALLSIVRRCPAVLTIFCHVVFGWLIPIRLVPSPFTAVTILLFPFLIMEKFRLERWIQNFCNVPLKDVKVGDYPSLLKEAEPMTLLLSGDDTADSTTLLLVWRNIESSVSSLEVGLVAARCVHTTAVAMEFADNVMSLAHFGFQVSQYGWIHGVSLMVKELIVHFGPQSSPEDAKYTHAAIHAVRNGQMVARNLHKLGEEENVQMIIQPILGSLAFVIGRGWLWDRQEEIQVVSSMVESEKDRKEDQIIDSSVTTNVTTNGLQDEGTAEDEGDRRLKDKQEISVKVDKLKPRSNDVKKQQSQPDEAFKLQSPPDKVVKSQSQPLEANTQQPLSDDLTLTSERRQSEDGKIRTGPSDDSIVEKNDSKSKLISCLDDKCSQNQSVDKAESEFRSKTVKSPVQEKDRVEGDFQHLSGGAEPEGKNEGINDATNEEKDVHTTLLEAVEMSAVMDLIVTAFEKGLIDELEKQEFCEKLAMPRTNLDGSAREQFILGMKKTLEGLLDSSALTMRGDDDVDGQLAPEFGAEPAENKYPAEQDCPLVSDSTELEMRREESKDTADELRLVDEMSALMNLIATTYEQGLIDELEKTKFCETLATVRTTSDYNTCEQFISGMKKTLQGILDSSVEQSLPALEDEEDRQASIVNSPSCNDNKNPVHSNNLSNEIQPRTVVDTMQQVFNNDMSLLEQTSGSVSATAFNKDNDLKQHEGEQQGNEFGAIWNAGLAIAGVAAVGGTVLAISSRNKEERDREKKDDSNNKHSISLTT